MSISFATIGDLRQHRSAFYFTVPVLGLCTRPFSSSALMSLPPGVSHNFASFAPCTIACRQESRAGLQSLSGGRGILLLSLLRSSGRINAPPPPLQSQLLGHVKLSTTALYAFEKSYNEAYPSAA